MSLFFAYHTLIREWRYAYSACAHTLLRYAATMRCVIPRRDVLPRPLSVSMFTRLPLQECQTCSAAQRYMITRHAGDIQEILVAGSRDETVLP